MRNGMTRADIIQAAFKVWGRAFYKNTSLRELAKELGVSKPALYRHFRNKQALLDAMYESFLDDHSAKVKGEFEQAARNPESAEVLFSVIRVTMAYYARDVYSFIFALIYVYGEQRLGNLEESLSRRGVDMGIFARLLEAFPPQVFQAAIATFTFSLAYFHRLGKSESPSGGAECWPSSPPPDHAIEGEISLVRAIITHGIGLEKRELEALDYEALEKKVSLATVAIEEDKLLHAVAEAVAGAGPWGVSMEMVACISGLSKSGLYAHFKSKRDMLVQVFVTEFDRIIDFAEESMKGASAAAERLYLAIFAICDYLRSRPDIIIALDWLRTRRFMLSEKKEQEVPSRIYRIFGGIRFSPDFESQPPDEEWLPAWILFLIVNSLMTSAKSNSNAQDYREWIQSLRGRRQPVSREKFAKLPNETFRNLYRFIARGIQDFTPQGDGRALAGQL